MCQHALTCALKEKSGSSISSSLSELLELVSLSDDSSSCGGRGGWVACRIECDERWRNESWQGTDLLLLPVQLRCKPCQPLGLIVKFLGLRAGTIVPAFARMHRKEGSEGERGGSGKQLAARGAHRPGPAAASAAVATGYAWWARTWP